MRKLLSSSFVIILLWPFGALAQSENAYDQVFVARHTPDGERFFLAQYELVGETEVDLSGLTVNRQELENADFPKFWTFAPDLRSYLISNSLVTNPNVIPPPALDLEQPTNSDESESESSAGPSWLAGIWEFIVSNSLMIIAILSLPFIAWIGRVALSGFMEWWRSRSIEMIYCGFPGSGKTSLIARLRHPNLPPSHFDGEGNARNPKRTRRVEKKKHDAIRKSGLIFKPTAIDVAGSKPSQFLERVIKEGASFSRRVVLVVLSPTKQNEAQIDERFVRDQYGYVFGLVAGTISSGSLRKPDLVAVFINKSDLFPGKSNELESAFQDSIAEISKICEERRMKFLKVVGSARTGENTQGLMDSIVEHLGG